MPQISKRNKQLKDARQKRTFYYKPLLDNKIQSHRRQPMEQLIDNLKNLNDNEFIAIIEQFKSINEGIEKIDQ